MLESVVGFAIGILGNYVAGITQPPIANPWQQRLEEQLADEAALRQSLTSMQSFRDAVRRACRDLSQKQASLSIPPQEREIWLLLSDRRFQDLLANWFIAGGIEEGAEIRAQLSHMMEQALLRSGVAEAAIAPFRQTYFERLDRAIFSNPVLTAWRHQRSLDYLREQVDLIRRLAEKAAGVYSAETRRDALERYLEKALREWDIIDLSYLPGDDIDLATQKLLLRQLYMPLRVTVEVDPESAADENAFDRLEKQRDLRRRQAAGRKNDGGAPVDPQERFPVGERLQQSQRLVVLGDPGGGKTTLLRWMATAYLLRYGDAAAASQIPDVETLPDRRWLPVLIRCRDLGEADQSRSFVDFLAQHLLKTELTPEEADVMRAVILDLIINGDVLLLVDGLDEITNPRVRVQFCQELERTATRYDRVHIVVTSRIVGYRDMPYRMGAGFEHSVIADLAREDKENFARRWIAVTEQHQTQREQEARTADLIMALHSNDRIERLTGNPMLLTTLALVKRKVGKLPSRRNKLYAEAVSVLLNWNPTHYEVIDEAEAVPQLAYLAYEMSRRGVQRLSEEDVLSLLDAIRRDYPNVRALRQRSPEQFLELLEARSSILIKSGGAWRVGRDHAEPVWEFRHLTLQEYLAARALLDGRYPDRNRRNRLAEEVAPLAGTLKEAAEDQSDQDLEVSDSWQETLRLLVADARDDDVDEVLLAILTPMEGEDAARTARPRAILAARCLADEPNVLEETAEQVLAVFVKYVSDQDGSTSRPNTSMDVAAIEVGQSTWLKSLQRYLIQQLMQQAPYGETHCGGLMALVMGNQIGSTREVSNEFLQDLQAQLSSDDQLTATVAALTVMELAYSGRIRDHAIMAERILVLIQKNEPCALAASWAMLWLSGSLSAPESQVNSFWRPSENEQEIIINSLTPTRHLHPDTILWSTQVCLTNRTPKVVERLIMALHRFANENADVVVRLAVVKALSQTGDMRAIDPLIARLDDPDINVCQATVEALVQLGDARAVEPLIAHLDVPDIRQSVISALGQFGDARAVEPLIAHLDDPEATIRWAIVDALRQLGDTRAVEPLITRLDDPEIQRSVISALGQFGDARAVEPLIAHLDDPEATIRWAIVDALRQLGDTRAVEPLITRLDDPEIQRSVISALGQLGDTRAVEPLLTRLDDPEIQQPVISALGQLGDARAVEPLIAHLDDPEIRESVISALGQLGDARAVEPLIAHLDDSEIQQPVVAALGQLGDAQAVEPLLARLEDEDPQVQLITAAALLRLGNQRGEARLLEALRSEQRDERTEAVRAYGGVSDNTTARLLSRDLDALYPWLDPAEPITHLRVKETARQLRLTEDAVRSRYETIAATLPLILEWQQQEESQ